MTDVGFGYLNLPAERLGLYLNHLPMTVRITGSTEPRAPGEVRLAVASASLVGEGHELGIEFRDSGLERQMIIVPLNR